MGAGGLGGSVGFEMPRVCPRAVDPLMLVLCHVGVSWTSPG
jgi:hypothetical protein